MHLAGAWIGENRIDSGLQQGVDEALGAIHFFVVLKGVSGGVIGFAYAFMFQCPRGVSSPAVVFSMAQLPCRRQSQILCGGRTRCTAVQILVSIIRLGLYFTSG
jgi:hypothetical protein